MTRTFDWLAQPYRWMEYVTFGRALERCRFHLLPRLTDSRSALLLGDGDGRFAARLLRDTPELQLVAVDSSPTMLAALHARCARDGNGARVQTLSTDLASALPQAIKERSYDLVVTHFFLDCLSTAAVEHLAKQILPQLRPGARWIISEFQVPATAMRFPARMLIRLLYLAFRLLANLQTRSLPDYRFALRRAGFTQTASTSFLAGLLVSEMWTMSGDSAACGSDD